MFYLGGEGGDVCSVNGGAELNFLLCLCCLFDMLRGVWCL